METMKPENIKVVEKAPAPQTVTPPIMTNPDKSTIQLSHGNIDVIQVKLLEKITQQNDTIISLLKKISEK